MTRVNPTKFKIQEIFNRVFDEANNQLKSSGATPAGETGDIQINQDGKLAVVPDKGFQYDFEKNDLFFSGGVEIGNGLSVYYIDEGVYSFACSPLVNNGQNYDDIVVGEDSYKGVFFLNSTDIRESGPDLMVVLEGETGVIDSIDGSQNIGVGLLSFDMGHPPTYYLTVYFPDTVFADEAAWTAYWTTLLSGNPFNTAYFRKSIFTNNGTGENYDFANPDNKEIVSGYNEAEALFGASMSAFELAEQSGNYYLNSPLTMVVGGLRIFDTDESEGYQLPSSIGSPGQILAVPSSGDELEFITPNFSDLWTADGDNVYFEGGDVYFNSANVDNLFYLSSSKDRIGIGTDDPWYSIDVVLDSAILNLRSQSENGAFVSGIGIHESNNWFGGGLYSMGENRAFADKGDLTLVKRQATGYGDPNDRFIMVVDNALNIGIGNDQPGGKLEIGPYLSGISYGDGGDGYNEITTNGLYTGDDVKTFRIKIFGTGEPDSFKWTSDGGDNWSSEIFITGEWQELSDNVLIKFANTTGHTQNQYWELTGYPRVFGIYGDKIGIANPNPEELFHLKGGNVWIETESDVAGSGLLFGVGGSRYWAFRQGTNGNLNIDWWTPVLWHSPVVTIAHTDGTVGISTLLQTTNIQPSADDTYYIGKNDDDSPAAYKGIILKDTTNSKYYRIEIINGVITATDLTD